MAVNYTHVSTTNKFQLNNYDYYRVIKGIMAFSYGLIYIAFAPVFIGFVLLLKRNFVEMYKRMKVKLYISFIAFMLVMGFRFTVYTFIEFCNVD